ncbi:MAG TPA: hypothetical protein VKG84_07045, partial [Candidatus Acidoferrales bacterium]|nr:hypothetical protein [Candidatus Acidoferrales bacterium]
DLYSLGVTLYELVTGLHPFEGDTGFTIMKGHIDGTFTPPRQVNPNISPALNEVILHAMAKDADERYQSAADFSAALQNVKEIIATLPMASIPGPAAASAAVTTPTRPAFTPPPPAPPAARPTAPSSPAMAGLSQPQMPQPQVAPPVHVTAPVAAPPPASVPATPAYVPPAATAPPAQPYAQAPSAQTSGAIVPPPQVSSSKRAFYIGLGSALTILLIVLTAMKLPGVFKGSPDSTTPAPAPTKPQPTPAPTPSPDVTPNPAPGGAVTPDNPPPSSPAADPAAAAAAAKKAREAAEAKKQQDAAAAAAAAAAQAAAEEAAKLYDEQENRFIHMSGRAAAMKTSFETLRNQQAAAGYSPSAEFTKAVSTMDQFLGRAEAALSNHDGATAKKYMDMAEPQIEILERKFGR